MELPISSQLFTKNNFHMECFVKQGSKCTNIGTIFSYITSVINNISIIYFIYLFTFHQLLNLT